MFRLTRDETLFRQFYEAEQQMPRWFADGNNTWTTDWESFQVFCNKCERIYEIDGQALIYVERCENNGNLHFSLLRGTPVNISELTAIRDILLADYNTLLAWIGSHNRGLKHIVEQCGMVNTNVEMRKGFTRNKVFVWQLYSVDKLLLRNNEKISII